MPASSGRARRRWSPPATSAHLDTRPSLSLGDVAGTDGWSSNLADHVVIMRPPCNQCEEQAMVWRRCGFCKEVFARCHEHTTADGHEMREAFEKHGHWQGTGHKV